MRLSFKTQFKIEFSGGKNAQNSPCEWVLNMKLIKYNLNIYFMLFEFKKLF